MVKFKASINPCGQIYLASEIRAELGTRELEVIGNCRAIVLYPRGTKPSEVLRSLKVVIEDLKHRKQLQEERENK